MVTDPRQAPRVASFLGLVGWPAPASRRRQAAASNRRWRSSALSDDPWRPLDRRARWMRVIRVGLSHPVSRGYPADAYLQGKRRRFTASRKPFGGSGSREGSNPSPSVAPAVLRFSRAFRRSSRCGRSAWCRPPGGRCRREGSQGPRASVRRWTSHQVPASGPPPGLYLGAPRTALPLPCPRPRAW